MSKNCFNCHHYAVCSLAGNVEKAIKNSPVELNIEKIKEIFNKLAEACSHYEAIKAKKYDEEV